MSNKNEFFTWEKQWRKWGGEDDEFIYSSVELIVSLGQFEKGHKFELCHYCPSIGIIEFFVSSSLNEDHKNNMKFKLVLSAIPFED